MIVLANVGPVFTWLTFPGPAALLLNRVDLAIDRCGRFPGE
jgi:hypothetical protein